VVSEASDAPTSTPCFQFARFVHEPRDLAASPPNTSALIGTPPASSAWAS